LRVILKAFLLSPTFANCYKVLYAISMGQKDVGKPMIHWMTPDHWTENKTPDKQKIARAQTLTQGCYDPKTYEFDASFKPYNPDDPMSVHTSWELLEYLHKHPEAELDARVVGWEHDHWKTKRIGRDAFLESFQKKNWDDVSFKENFGGQNSVIASPLSPTFSVGNDFTPLLGGPFYKNLYYYQDYIRMHSEAFYAKNHDPVANAISQITRDFVIGSGFEVQCDTSDDMGRLAMAVWKAFEEVNDLQAQIDHACEEISIYGEVMWWKLPFQQDKIIYRLQVGDVVPYGIIPRVRLLDPSNLVEIVTYPEDISRVLFYCWLTPTQWQMFTAGIGEGAPKQASIQPALKFIYRTIMADQILHFKVNTVTGEKRGRTDYFPILSYLKRLRDTVDYQLIALQKCAAWAIDTSIDGDQTDIDNYLQAQAALGTIAPAGSEFVHSKAITRTMIANQGASNINSDAFSLALSMCAIGSGIPVSYFGSHLSGGQTKASALVATEPVAKKMEKRREVMKRMIRKLWDYVMESAGLPKTHCDIIFPEIITQDRSQKLKDLVLCQNQRWLSPETVANIAAKELQVQHYDYNKEIQKMEVELPKVPMPLTGPASLGKMGSPIPTEPEAPQAAPTPESSSITSQDKRQERMNDQHL
jgi:hypothetical protein